MSTRERARASTEGGRITDDSPLETPEELARDVRVTVRGAAEARAINVSETGVLAETTSRLRPGTVVDPSPALS